MTHYPSAGGLCRAVLWPYNIGIHSISNVRGGESLTLASLSPARVALPLFYR